MTDSYPDFPGSRSIDTSIDAAKDIAPKVGRLQGLVLASVRNAGARGVTTNEIAELLNIGRDSIQPRTSELKRLGLIRDSGLRRLNENRKSAIVWVAEGADR